MAAAEDDFAFALAAVKRLLVQLQSDVTARINDGRRGEVLARHVLAALEAIDQRVTDEVERFPRRRDEKSKRAAARQLRFYTQMVWGTHVALEWLRPDKERALSLGAIYFADETALALLGVGVEITPIASGEYMYSTSTWPFDWLLRRELGEESPDGQRPIPIVLAFPAREQHTMLLHCLFAHELSHAAVRDKNLTRRLLDLLEDDSYEEWLDAATGSTGDLAPLARDRAQGLVELWLEELLCDALAFALLGPAYLFAFAEMGLSVGWAEPDDEHPSMALRTRLLVAFAQRNEWSTFLEDKLPDIWQWFQYVADGPSIAPSSLESFAERVCRNAFDEILDLVEDTAGDTRFTLETWDKWERILTELLENDILPAQATDGNPAPHASILLASWLQAIATHGGSPSAISEAVAESRYQRFVAKALEMSTTLKMWEAVETGDAA